MRIFLCFLVLSCIVWAVFANDLPSDFEKTEINVIDGSYQNKIHHDLLIRSSRTSKKHGKQRKTITRKKTKKPITKKKDRKPITKKKKKKTIKKEPVKKKAKTTTAKRRTTTFTQRATSTKKVSLLPTKPASTTKVPDIVTTTTSSASTSSSTTTSTVYTSGLPLPTYTLKQANRGANFFKNNQWEFWSNDDPTHGTVDYVDQNTATSLNLIGLNSNNQAFVRASQEDLELNQYRPSVRFQSVSAYDAALVIMDVAKMPVGCATWPALWTVMGAAWPEYGETDVMEGIGYTSGGKNANLMSVHMNDTAYLTSSNDSYQGQLKSNDCMTNYGLGNTGCSFYDNNSNGPSWGVPFNNAGGGIWAVLWGNKMGVRIWFWGRQSGLIPSELNNPSSSPGRLDPSRWGKPMANFQSTLIDQKLRQQNIVLDITINGDWAGNVPMDNEQQCGSNRTIALAMGSNYADAEFILNGIDVYT